MSTPNEEMVTVKRSELETLKLHDEACTRGINELWTELEAAGFVPCNNGWLGEARRALAALAEARKTPPATETPQSGWTDKDRLDWLGKNNYGLYFEVGDPEVGAFSAWQVYDDKARKLLAFDNTLRAAIDAAMSASLGKETTP